MKVLITGAAGNVGSATAAALHAAGFDLRLTDRRARRDLPTRFDVLDLLNRDGVYRLVEGCDAVVHFGNHPNQHASDAQRIYAENAAMNINVFQAALELGVKKIVFASSVQVVNGDRQYRDQGEVPPSMLKYLPLDSDTPANPRNVYSLSKRAAELLLENYLAPQGIQCVALRLPWTPSAKWWNGAKLHLSHRPPHFLDEGFSGLHAEDAGELAAAYLRADLPGYRVYIPSIRSPFTTMPVAEIVAKYYPNVPLRRPVAELTSLVDISRITKETGWVPKHDIRDP